MAAKDSCPVMQRLAKIKMVFLSDGGNNIDNSTCNALKWNFVMFIFEIFVVQNPSFRPISSKKKNGS